MSDIPGKRYRSYCCMPTAVWVLMIMYVATSAQVTEVDRPMGTVVRPRSTRFVRPSGNRGGRGNCSRPLLMLRQAILWTTCGPTPMHLPMSCL